MKVKEYKGYIIQLENNGTFEALKDGCVETKVNTLTILIKNIDKIFKEDFKRFIVYSTETFEKLTVTSINPVDGTIWVIDKDNRRERKTLRWSNLIKNTPKNMKIIEELKTFNNEKDRLLRKN